ncbi:rhamnogalacturonan endolyase [Chitinophaga sp. YR627]|uniref:rhamnogalacturonan lyase family protein n=1 Tax=Chitinophaga sp. YR627 TaxID=1881041 RepID=UPI0008E3DAA3|nr:T9SS type A sorting domain-containing protein [Chitinophaga sp. YR627]SFO97978.1 rhamnogalacturonan endolyase [Chitinophaga sp. YR627]
MKKLITNFLLFLSLLFFSFAASAQSKQMEFLSRAPVAVRQSSSAVFVSWRMLGTDPAAISFNVYRNGVKLNATPITNSTNYVDNVTTNGTYTIRPVINGTEQAPTAAVSVWTSIYKTIPLQVPPGGTTPAGEAYTYTANDCSVGDLDGDGEYEIILKWDPTNAKDNSQSGYTGNVYIDAYRMNGTRMWRVDLGRNIRAGAHYTQFMVYDLDGDGKAEVAMKTADATIDGVGTVIGSASADYRNSSGYVLSGPEFLTIFNGQTGAAMATTNYLPARGTVSSWGDNYGNRVDRFVNAVAYLDGARPSLIMGRGYYTRLVRVAWDWRNGQLTQRWTFDSNASGNSAYAGQGNHQVTVGDVDNDGKQELINGSSAINDNGSGLYANGLGHGDAMHMTDLDPERPGQELWQCHETQSQYGNYGIEFRDAGSGTPIWGRGPSQGVSGDIGRAMAGDVDPTYLGYEVWASAGELYTCKGVSIGTAKPSNNFGIWWDGDLCRELLDGVKLDKWNYTSKALNRILTLSDYGATSNNSTKANPCLTADLLGDWREEILLRSTDNSSLLLFTTTTPTSYRLYTLMHNPQYRTAIAWQNTAYNQPPYPDYYLGTGMSTPPQPNIYIPNSPALRTAEQAADIIPDANTLAIRPNPVDNAAYLDYKSENTRLIVVISAGDGRVVFRRTGSVTELNNGLNAVIGGFAKGMYIVQLRDGKKQFKGKIVKQ